MSATAPAAPVITDAERDELRRHGILLTKMEELYNWGRSRSVWPLNFGLACCAIEMIAASMAKFDIARSLLAISNSPVVFLSIRWTSPGRS